MKECPSCKKRHDDSWSVCLLCGTGFDREGPEEESLPFGLKRFPSKKTLIVVFSLLLILIIPLILLSVYIAVFTDIGLGLRRVEDRQAGEAIISEEKERKEAEEKSWEK